VLVLGLAVLGQRLLPLDGLVDELEDRLFVLLLEEVALPGEGVDLLWRLRRNTLRVGWLLGTRNPHVIGGWEVSGHHVAVDPWHQVLASSASGSRHLVSFATISSSDSFACCMAAACLDR
jgi:hypothetical protein